MTISEFLMKLYLFCGNGESEANFTIQVLSEITTEQDDSIFDKTSEYIKRIYNGKKAVTKKTASYILTHIDKAAFDSYIYNLVAEDSLLELCVVFQDSLGKTTQETISFNIAELLITILKNIITKVVAPINMSPRGLCKIKPNLCGVFVDIVRLAWTVSRDDVDTIVECDSQASKKRTK